MKVIHFSTFDEIGGAARAANRLHHGLLKQDVDSRIYVQKKRRDQVAIHALASTTFGKLVDAFRPRIDALPLGFYKKKQDTPFSIGWLPRSMSFLSTLSQGGLAHIHWVNGGFLSLANLCAINKRAIFTLHDSWMFTGGCHVPNVCENFKDECHQCPQLGSSNKFDLSWVNFQRKKQALGSMKPVFVAPSAWMAIEARSSALLSHADIRVIPNGLDVSLFSPIEKAAARNALNLPQDKTLILFGAMSATSNPNKGYEHLMRALRILSAASSSNPHIVIFGAVSDVKTKDFPFPVTALGEFLDEASLPLVYSAADIMCVPSVKESFCQVATEAMACGLPVVSFETSGLIDINLHLETGYVAKAFDPEDFARGIDALILNEELRTRISSNARKRVVEKFSIDLVARKHIKLYEELMAFAAKE